MPLKAIHDTIDDIDEPYRDLYTEKNGKWELTGIAGAFTQANMDRVQAALDKERAEHKATQDKLTVWTDLDHEDIMTKLDRIPELEAAAKGPLDEAQIEEIVTRRVEGTLASRTAPLERQVKTLTGKLEAAAAERDTLATEKQQRRVHDGVREAMTQAKVLPEAYDDALLLAERVFEIREDDGAIVTRDQVGTTPGVDPQVWLTEMRERRPHWWPSSQGGGAKGSGAGLDAVDNPWNPKAPNLTEQARIMAENPDRAKQLAKAAGVEIAV